jgi:hypothetical protein
MGKGKRSWAMGKTGKRGGRFYLVHFLVELIRAVFRLLETIPFCHPTGHFGDGKLPTGEQFGATGMAAIADSLFPPIVPRRRVAAPWSRVPT